jgi:hypothetical protein
MSEIKKQQRKQSKGEQDQGEQLSKGAETERERSTNRPNMKK